MRTVLLFSLTFSAIYAQASDDSSSEPAVPWFSVVISILALLILFSGILVQKRWKEKKN